MPKKQKGGKKRAQPAASPLPSDLEDEVDKFHKQREKLSLNVEDDLPSDDDSIPDEDDAVLDVSDDSGSEEMDSDEEMERGTRYGKLARQAKTLEAKLRIAAGEGESGEEEEEEEDDEEGAARGARWGAGKRAYYDADVVDMEGSDEEEALADEEAEAVRLQRAAAAALRPDDFGAAGADETSSEEEEDDSDGEEPTLGARAAGGAAVEAVARDDDAAAAAVRQDALELSALLGELRAVLGEVRGRLGPLLREVRQGELATAEGVSYLEAKHTLLVHYAASIVFYLLLKAEGRPVRDHPVIARLVEVRSYLEKVRPVDKRLQYQIEKLLAAAAAAGGAGEEGAPAGGDELRHGPRPEALVAGGGGSGGAEEGADGEGVYRPPRLNPVSMELEGEREGAAGRRARRAEEVAARRAARSSLVQELAAELAGAPEELGAGAPLGMDTVAALRQRQRMAARDAVEEELMVRVPLSRQERKQLKAQRRAGLSGKALLDDFADDVADLVDGVGGGGDGGGAPGEFGRHRANQKFGADLAAQAAAAARRAPRSGDDDLPAREALSERRAKMDGARAAAALSYGDDLDGGDGGKKKRRADGEEDEFYAAAKEAAAARKKARRDARAPADLLPPAEDPTAEGARRINSAIEKNRGLTPHRKKELKNPRKKHRVKFAEAEVRRRGQVQAVREQGGAYGGEGTGIKSRVSKSVKF